MINYVIKVKNAIKRNIFFTVMVLITIGILIINPVNGKRVLMSFLDMAKSVGPMLILMFILLGFIQVWMQSSKSKEFIENNKGIKCTIFAYFFGVVVCGPIYPGFSLGKMIIGKGGRISTVIILLSTWATAKVALLPFEVKILGVKFTIIRWVVTLISTFFLSIICEFLINGINSYIKRKQLKNNAGING